MSEARRAFLAAEWREATAEDGAVKNAYPLAKEIAEETLFTAAADATTEATRRQVMRSVLRHRYQVVLPLDSETETIDLGDVISLTHDRYGLSAGALFRVIGAEPDAENRRLTLTVWGPSDPTSRLAIRLALAGTGTVPVFVSGSGGVLVSLRPSGTGLRGNHGTGSSAVTLALAGSGG